MTHTAFKLDSLAKPKTPAKRKAAAHKLSESELAKLAVKNWGEDAYKAVVKFRRIWAKEGAKLEVLP